MSIFLSTMEFRYDLKIPKERIAVLIGKKGETKKEIESVTKSKLTVDSNEGDVFISGEDGLGLYNAREVIKAVGRGFNPEVALLLLKPDYVFEALNIKEYAKTRNSELRLKGRVIGKDGKCRKTIEELTECYVSVYGKSIGIIGEAEGVANARYAIDSLLKGSTHANVYKYLEKKRRELKRKQLQGGEFG
jgi:ribosomal RNA assembly protein